MLINKYWAVMAYSEKLLDIIAKSNFNAKAIIDLKSIIAFALKLLIQTTSRAITQVLLS